MKIKKWTIGVLVMVGLLVGSLGAGAFLSGRPGKAAAAPAAQTADPCANDDDGMEAPETEDVDDVQEEVQCGPQDENEADEAGESDVEDGAEDAVADTGDETAPAGLAVTAVQAQTIAEEANPGAAALAVEYDRENGQDIWEVELDNGQDVKVDAGSGQILLTEARD
ncbi:MAG: PepSY domain-containing protein [Ardenticatenaceae bacterium]|nr:PepSY domain-containing protein [Ardenticatenaceae bacterium]MCB9446598.1 PepSY domain-containing protein [Ardenticatenaceae bacterium]